MTQSFPSHAEIVVIGGGIIGCSVAYHLARDHKADVVLLERGRLTGGSTWHAAGLVGQLRSSASVTQVLRYSVDLYTKLAAETGLETGWKMTGCLRLAISEQRWIEYQRLATTARIIHGDLLKQDYSSADLLTVYLLPVGNEKVTPMLEKQLKKGTRVVAHDFEFTAWKPVKIVPIPDDGEGRSHTLYLYQR